MKEAFDMSSLMLHWLTGATLGAALLILGWAMALRSRANLLTMLGAVLAIASLNEGIDWEAGGPFSLNDILFTMAGATFVGWVSFLLIMLAAGLLRRSERDGARSRRLIGLVTAATASGSESQGEARADFMSERLHEAFDRGREHRVSSSAQGRTPRRGVPTAESGYEMDGTPHRETPAA